MNEIEKKYDDKGNVYWSEGHNAQPVTNGRCCDDCNDQVVIPVRISSLLNRGKEDRLSKVQQHEGEE
tara:strand:+ start:221 stop:421 length:201 start_codon:yes stop_codon:yes gene_type:complete